MRTLLAEKDSGEDIKKAIMNIVLVIGLALIVIGCIKGCDDKNKNNCNIYMGDDHWKK